MSVFQKSEQLNELAAALAKAQAKMDFARKDSKNPFFNSAYADLASCIDASRPSLTEFGLSVVQLPSFHEGEVRVMTMLLHSSGQWIAGELSVKPSKSDAQGIGSAITYLRRYAYSASVGLGVEDDDGNAAVEAPKKRPTPAQAFTGAKPGKSTATLGNSVPVPDAVPTEEEVAALEMGFASLAAAKDARKRTMARAKANKWTDEEIYAEVRNSFGKEKLHDLTRDELARVYDGVASPPPPRKA